MLVCHCKQVRCNEVRECVREGAYDARSVGERCGAGTGCGGCKPLLSKLVQLEVAKNQRTPATAA